MTRKQENLIFLDRYYGAQAWINENTTAAHTPHREIFTTLKDNHTKGILPISQMKFYYKRRCRYGGK